MSEELISVIVPVYMVEDYIEKCLCSVLNQSYKNLEIIIINDGTKDNSAEICEKYARIDNRIIVINQENCGQSVARNKGIEVAKGRLLAFIDSDDTIEQEFIKTLYDRHLEDGADIVCSGIRELYDGYVKEKNTDLILSQTPKQAIENLLDENYMRFEVWNKLYTREVIGNTNFKPGKIHEEIDFLTKLIFKANKIVYVDKPLYNYLVNRVGNTNSSFKENRMNVFVEMENLEDELKSNNMEELDIKLYLLIMKYCLTFYAIAYASNDNTIDIRTQIHNIFLKYYKKKQNKGKNMANNNVFKYWFFKNFPIFYAKLILFKNKIKK